MANLFRSKENTRGYNLGTLLRKRAVKGQIGIEIEVEGKNLPKGDGNPDGCPVSRNWKYVKDGSLRGYDNAEYVLMKPIDFDEVEGALIELWDLFKSCDSRIDESNRTSVHVHLNVQPFFMNRFASFVGLYLSVEELLTAFCGDHRVGNLFCLRAIDAPAIVTKFKRFIQNDGNEKLSDGLHYAGLNGNALSKFGSIEIRSMRGPQAYQEVLTWVSMLRRLYELSEAYTDPREVCAGFSSEGPVGFLYRVMGDLTPVLRAGIDYTDEQIRDSMYRGIRLAQDVCYCRDWDLYKPEEVSTDPFGRIEDTVVMDIEGYPQPLTLSPTTAAGWGTIPNTAQYQAYVNQLYANMAQSTPPIPATPSTWEIYEPDSEPEWFEPGYDEED